MSKKQEINNGKGRTGYTLAIIALVFGFLLAKKYYTFILLWGFVPFPVNLGDRYIWLLDEPELRMKSLILGIISIGVTLYFIRRIYKEKDGIKKLKLGVISVIVSILFSLSFYVVAPSYTFKTYPQLFMYMDSKGEYIEKPAYYLWLVDKLGFYQETYRPFKTLDDAIQGLEFAKERKQGGLYGKIFNDLEKFGYEKVLDSYSDLTFQWCFLIKILEKNYDDGTYSHNYSGVEKYIKDVSYITKLNSSKSLVIKNIAIKVSQIYNQYMEGTISKEEFLKQTTVIFREIYYRPNDIQGVEYSIF